MGGNEQARVNNDTALNCPRNLPRIPHDELKHMLHPKINKSMAEVAFQTQESYDRPKLWDTKQHAVQGLNGEG